MKKRPVFLLLLGLLSAGVSARDLGTTGHLFIIAEPDMLTFIKQRLQAMEDSGEMAKMQKETEERVKAHAVRPTPVAGLSPAVTTRSFAFDPTFTVRETITDMQGRVIAKQGDQVNPLDRVPFSEVLYFLDGDNRAQVAWVKKQIGGQTNFKVILVNGNIRETSDTLDEPVYFDQAGVLTTKFGFTHTPVRISRDDRVLKVEEVALK
ncbi:type-F conjugative transfer system protein TraW [Erwinia persicina]|uniref:Type-F conjugative transfer system protein TraW n=1 Tax=Erwinia persicina TaxID=55211 RepID=A0A4U3EU52_9GAMM|nr:type-F conjugative transfer system protein TraW [Erwinia persicina]MBD8170295.1 type-F conjugative transfer system protein TraW [Erwinia persicina]TKJ83316.1 type-F conjugative transfer system protein TraW [Erwinia persicina]